MATIFDQGKDDVAKKCRHFAANRDEFRKPGIKEAHHVRPNKSGEKKLFTKRRAFRGNSHGSMTIELHGDQI